MATWHQRRPTRAAVALSALVLFGYSAHGQESPPIVIPPNATALEGVPTLRVDTTPDTTTRRQLDAAEATASRLQVQIKDGHFYWASRDGRQLALSGSGDFTYLSSTAPGRYVRIRRLNDRLTYVEHLDTALGSVTFWGELRIVVGK
jgi:hypothetical protein